MAQVSFRNGRYAFTFVSLSANSWPIILPLHGCFIFRPTAKNIALQMTNNLPPTEDRLTSAWRPDTFPLVNRIPMSYSSRSLATPADGTLADVSFNGALFFFREYRRKLTVLLVIDSRHVQS